jgi:hypothetical protein
MFLSRKRHLLLILRGALHAARTEGVHRQYSKTGGIELIRPLAQLGAVNAARTMRHGETIVFDFFPAR